MAEKPEFFYCASCGVQIKSDLGGTDPNNTWCSNCCHPDGSHKSYEEVKKNIVQLFLSPDAPGIMGEKVEQSDVGNLADDYMRRMPAWHEGD